MRQEAIKQIAVQASQRVEDRDTQKKWALRHYLDRLPGMRRHASYKGNMSLYMCVLALDSHDCRMILTSAVRGMPIERALIREKEKMAAKKKSDGTGTDAINDLDYILLNVSRNLWVGPADPSGAATYTKVPSEAMVLKRIPALDQFINDCKNNAGDYNVPVRLQDLVACMMGLDE